MTSELLPFRNVAIVGHNDRMYHRIGRFGESDAVLPRMSAAAESAQEGTGNRGEQRACYLPAAVRRPAAPRISPR